MVIADINTLDYLPSSASFRFSNPPAIYRTLSDNELPESGDFYNGSGGKFSFFDSSYTGSKTIVSTTEESYTLSRAVDEIMQVFSLTLSDLAIALEVKSRKTVYNWINGDASPRKETMKRVFDLLMIARAWEYSGMKSSKDSLHTTILNDKSLFDLICADKLDKEEILFAGSRAQLLETPISALRDPFA